MTGGSIIVENCSDNAYIALIVHEGGNILSAARKKEKKNDKKYASKRKKTEKYTCGTTYYYTEWGWGEHYTSVYCNYEHILQ